MPASRAVVRGKWRVLARMLGGEEGVAVVMVVGTASVLAILTSIIAVQSISNLRQAGLEASYERALHVSDSGVDHTLFRLRVTRGIYTTGENLPSSFPSAAAERQWVLDQADAAVAANPSRLVTVREGQWVSIRPSNSTVIYSVGYVPSHAAPRRTRIVRAEYDFAPFAPITAMLTGGSLEMSGNPTISGSTGNIHANGDIGIFGQPNVSGFVSASGDYTVTGGPTIGDTANTGGGRPQIDVPHIDPRANYAMSEYDLCPDGTVRTGPSYTGGPEAPNATVIPCQGTALANTSAGLAYRGWAKSGDDALQGAKWDYSGPTAYDGVYYLYLGSATISGTPGTPAAPWRLTLFAEALAIGDEPHCPHIAGDIQVSGNPYILSHDKGEGLGLIAGRDLQLSGNPSSGDSYVGLYAAHEQFTVSGNPSLVGALIANDPCDTPGSPVSVSSISGNPRIRFDGGSFPLGNNIRTSLWLEI